MKQTHYYYDHSEYPHIEKLIFQCEATGILDAHEQFEKALGKDPSKMPMVGCATKPLPLHPHPYCTVIDCWTNSQPAGDEKDLG
jgi:hypothetical protein